MTWHSAGKMPVRAALAAHLKRYGWLRLYDNFPTHPKWRVIAAQVGLPVHNVIAVAVALLCKANGAKPRGSLAEFSPLECGASLDLSADCVVRIYAALEQMGWIDQEYLTTWDDRQPDKEDPTANERQRRRRAKIKGQWPDCHAVTGVTQRDVTLDKSRPDKTSKEWLSEEGLATVCRHGKLLQSQAQLTMSRWRRDIGDDEALRGIINASIALAADGRFLNLISEGVARHRREATKGLGLPLGPVQMKSKDEWPPQPEQRSESG